MTRRKKIIIWVIIIVIIGVGVAYSLDKIKNPEVIYDTAKVEKGTLQQTVSSTGKVKSAADINLNFKTTGKLAEINVKVGDQVKADQELASLDLKDLEASVREAEANLQVAQANYNKLKAGSRSESVAVSQATVDQAQTAYDNSLRDYENVVDTTAADIIKYENALTDAQTSLVDTKNAGEQDIVNAKDSAVTTMETYQIKAQTSLEVVDDILYDTEAQTTLSVKNKDYLLIALEHYNDVEDSLALLDSYIETAKSTKDTDDVDFALDKTLNTLNLLSELLDDTAKVLVSTITSVDLSETALDALKTSLRTEQTNTNTAISTVQTSQQTLDSALLAYTVDVNTAQSAVNTAQDTLNQSKATQQSKIDTAQAAVNAAISALEIAVAKLDLEKAPARQEDLDLQAAKVKQAEAALEIAKNQLSDNILQAPADGVVTAVNYEIGETTALTKAVVTMFSEGRFEIEVDISEADIAKVRIGNTVNVDFDAYGSEMVFTGEVTYIEPAETVIQDVVYYKVTIQFDDKGFEIKPGLTANTEILTAEKKGVLMTLQRAVYEREGQKYIKVLSVGAEVEKAITIGLKGDGGLVEVLDGLVEDEEVIISVKNGK